jgi:HSP20 family molecular chaperone IbpA
MYSYPPTNVYMTEDKSLIFEFALAGFDEDSLEIEFRGDHMYLSGSISEDLRDNENVKYFKRKLKFKDIDGQKYFVPSDKFAQANTEASYKSGVLVVTIPARDTVEPKDSIKVKVGSSKSGGSSKSSSKSSSSKSSSSTDSQAGGSAKESGSQSNQSKGDTE